MPTATTLQTIIIALVTMFIGFLFREIYDNILKPAWSKSNIDQKRKRALRRWLTYLSIAMAMALIIIFMSLTKYMVLLLCVLFSILSIFIIYDYAIGFLNYMVLDRQKDENYNRRQYLYNELSYTTDKERRQQLIQQLKELDNS